jgi:hypothetical protein
VPRLASVLSTDLPFDWRSLPFASQTSAAGRRRPPVRRRRAFTPRDELVDFVRARLGIESDVPLERQHPCRALLRSTASALVGAIGQG